MRLRTAEQQHQDEGESAHSRSVCPSESRTGQSALDPRSRRSAAGFGVRRVGVGKTRLVAALAEAASEAGWVLRHLFGSVVLRDVPFGALSHALDSVPSSSDPLHIMIEARPWFVAVDDDNDTGESGTTTTR